jgi:hypothetical protein
MNDYSEDTLVGRPAIALLSELGYFVFLDAVSNIQFTDKTGFCQASPKNQKTPAYPLDSRGFCILWSDADGARTRNHWIDSPVL